MNYLMSVLATCWNRIYHIGAMIVIPLVLLLLLLTACTSDQLEQIVGTDLDSLRVEQAELISLDTTLSPLPQGEKEISQRIQHSFNQLFITSTFRTRIEHREESFILGGITMTPPYTLEIDDKNPTSEHMAIRISAQDWESIHIGSNAFGDFKTWAKSEAGWQGPTDTTSFTFVMIVLIADSNPYYIWMGEHTRYAFRSRAIGYESIDSRLAEVYEVERQILVAEDTYETNDIAHVWLDASSGVPIMSVREPFTFTFEVDNSIEIKPPCTETC